jgi:predicted O-linked N-acetylglucosamine transferase (SPINDLY family)
MADKKIGRNDPCACGSGKKYKKCCLLTAPPTAAPVSPATFQRLQLAVEHHQAGRLNEAQALYQRVLKASPDNADALHYSGLIYYQTGDTATAVSLISKSITINPSSLMYCNLGAAQQALGHHDLAIASYRSAIALQPDYAEAYSNLGAALQEQGQLTDSIKAFQQALSLNPYYASAQNNLGNAFLVQGNLEAAIECYRQSLALNADNLSTHSNLLMALSYYPQCSAAQYLAEAQIFGNKVLAKASPYQQWPAFEANRPGRKLRIGFVSGDFKVHPVSYFLESIFQHCATADLELVAYATQFKEDALTRRIKSHFSEWNIISGISDDRVAQKIYADKIDILVDLSGHTSANRLAVFAWKPAPVQVSWLGFFASTGVPGIDFLLTDAISVPEAQSKYFSEKLYYLPETRLCFTPPDTDLLPSKVPAKRNDYITFGCFQNLSKINNAVIVVWAQIFKVLPTARLVIRNKQMSCLVEREGLQRRLISAGMQAERITIDGLIAHEDYLASYAEIDIMLDTFPYPGGTTTCEALWMGVPTLTLAGNTLLARQGASLLHCAGLPEWIARDESDYIAKAVQQAANIERLSSLRESLRAQLLTTALFDAERFTQQLAEAMFAMWQQRLADK